MKKVLGMVALAAVVALPGVSFAQTYAYVNTSGDVSSVEADTANAALMTAPNIGVHSGVMLINSSSDDVLDQTVTGV
jgi:hypothetical protein